MHSSLLLYMCVHRLRKKKDFERYRPRWEKCDISVRIILDETLKTSPKVCIRSKKNAKTPYSVLWRYPLPLPSSSHIFRIPRPMCDMPNAST